MLIIISGVFNCSRVLMLPPFVSIAIFFLYCMNLHSLNQDSPQQPYSEQSRAAMELISSVTGVDEEGRSRQRILTFAAKRYHHNTFCPS